MPLTDEQRNLLPAVQAMFHAIPCSYGTAESVEQRSRHPATETLPHDVTVHIETAPPSLHPDPILKSTGMLKTPERVPVYFYSLGGKDQAGAQVADDAANTRVIFFIHGGGNVGGHPTFELCTQYYVQLLRAVRASSPSGETASECVLVAPSYRLATVPENAFPAALQDVVAAYDHVLGKGYKPSNIIVAGDSAGGNHAIVLTHLIMQSGRSRPGGVVAIAPASIQTNELLSDYASTLAENDVVGLATHEQFFNAYVGTPSPDLVRTDPLVSGSFLPFALDWPRTLILVGDADLLIDASRELEKRLAALGRPVELVEYDERPHGWWVLPQIFPKDILDSAERIARFVLQ